MQVLTFYADADLPDQPRRNQDGFDWRQAIDSLRKSAERQGYSLRVVTDERTNLPDAWLRVGNAKQDGIMLWLLKAQAAAIAESTEPAVMVSPDSLIARPLNFLFGEWDVSLFTRPKPKPIVNSVIAFRPCKALSLMWDRVVERSLHLSAESKAWGADIDALVDVMGIIPNEDGQRRVEGVRAKFIPLRGHFESVKLAGPVSKLPAAVWDFKGARKHLMQNYARLIKC